MAVERLFKSTTAYSVFVSDVAGGRLSHTYLVRFDDGYNLKYVLALLAFAFFGADLTLERRMKSGSFPDVKFYPEEGGKYTADGIAEIIADSALKPLEGSRKLYILCDFQLATPLIQNKLLKILEEPPEGVHFILGTTSLAPVLPTVLSRSKVLDVPPFTEEEIYKELERAQPDARNKEAARFSNGIFGKAQSMLSGDWFKEVKEGAEAVFFASGADEFAAVSAKYGDTRHKKELLSYLQSIYFTALTEGGKYGNIYQKPTLIYALGELEKAFADLRFNAYFAGLLYDFMLKVAMENKKWQKLRE